MADSRLSNLFGRHDRPQSPIYLGHNQHPVPRVRNAIGAERAQESVAADESEPVLDGTTTPTRDSWDEIIKFAEIIQPGRQFLFCVTRTKTPDMILFRRMNPKQAKSETTSLLKARHRNVIKLKKAFRDSDGVYVGLEYCRWTLQDVFSVHIPLQPQHVLFVARSVSACSFPLLNERADEQIYDAVRHLASVGIVHGELRPSCIRMCDDARLVVSE